MTWIRTLFYAVMITGYIPFYVGIRDVVIHKLFSSNKSNKAKRINYRIFQIISITLIILFSLGVYILTNYFENSKLCDYICVIIYTTLLSLLANNALYLSPSAEAKTSFEVFRKGFARGNLNNIFSDIIPLKSIINFAYLVFLICAQIEDLEIVIFPSGFSYFCELNKYGIVIILGVERIIKSINPDKQRSKILREAFVEKEKEDEEYRKNHPSLFKRISNGIKEKRNKKKNNKNK